MDWTFLKDLPLSQFLERERERERDRERDVDGEERSERLGEKFKIM